jgi:hypothetical protein
LDWARPILTDSNALSRRDDFVDLTVGGALVLGLFDLFTKPGVHLRSGFFGPAERYYRSVGDVQLAPAGFRQFAPILERMAPRVMMVQATEADSDGFVNLSLHHGATFDELLRASRDPDRLLMVETSPHFPRTAALAGSRNQLHLDEIDVLVAGDEHPFELPGEEPNEADLEIARLAAGLSRPDGHLADGYRSDPDGRRRDAGGSRGWTVRCALGDVH